MQTCTICGLWYPAASRDCLDMCSECYTRNFAGAQPPLDVHAPVTQDEMARFVDATHQLTPRQVEAMSRLADAWRRQTQVEF